jgi:hypothetical protein
MLGRIDRALRALLIVRLRSLLVRSAALSGGRPGELVPASGSGPTSQSKVIGFIVSPVVSAQAAMLVMPVPATRRVERDHLLQARQLQRWKAPVLV